MSKAAVAKGPPTINNGFRPTQPTTYSTLGRSKPSPVSTTPTQMKTNTPAPTRPGQTNNTPTNTHNNTTATNNPASTTPNPAGGSNNATRPQNNTRPNLSRNSYMSKSSPALAAMIRQQVEGPQPVTPNIGRGPTRPCAPPASPRAPWNGPGSSVLAAVTKPPPRGPTNNNPSTNPSSTNPNPAGRTTPATNPARPLGTSSPSATQTKPAPVSTTNNLVQSAPATKPGPQPRDNNTTASTGPSPKPGSAHVSGPLPTAVPQRKPSDSATQPAPETPPTTPTGGVKPIAINGNSATAQGERQPSPRSNPAGSATNSNPSVPTAAPGSNNPPSTNSNPRVVPAAGNGSNIGAKPPPLSSSATNSQGNITNNQQSTQQTSPRTQPIRPPPVSPLNSSNPGSNIGGPNRPTNLNVSAPVPARGRPLPAGGSAQSSNPSVPTQNPATSNPTDTTTKPTPTTTNNPVGSNIGRGTQSTYIPSGAAKKPGFTPFPTIQQVAVAPVPIEPVSIGTTSTQSNNNPPSPGHSRPQAGQHQQQGQPKPLRPAPRPLGTSVGSDSSENNRPQRPQTTHTQHPQHQQPPAESAENGGSGEQIETPDGVPPYPKDKPTQQTPKKGTKKLPALPPTGQQQPPPSQQQQPTTATNLPARPARLQSAMVPTRTISEKVLSYAEKQELLRNRKPPPQPPAGQHDPAAGPAQHPGSAIASLPSVNPRVHNLNGGRPMPISSLASPAGGATKGRATTVTAGAMPSSMSMYVPPVGAGSGGAMRPGDVKSSYIEVGGTLQKTGASGTRVFGVALDELRYKSKIGVPTVMKKLLDGVENLGGFEQEGIFRIPGTETEKVGLRKQLDSGNFLISPELGVHSVATLVKDWLRSLTTPLIPPSLYNRALESVAKPDDSVNIVSELPEPNRSLVVYLVSYLKRLLDPEVVKKTRMDVENFATAFGPCFFITPDDVNDNLEKLYSSLQNQKKFVSNLLSLREDVVNMGSGVEGIGDGAIKSGISSRAKNLTRTVSTKFSKWQEMSMKKAAARRRINSQKKQRISDAAKEEKETKKLQEMLEQEENDGPTTADGPAAN